MRFQGPVLLSASALALLQLATGVSRAAPTTSFAGNYVGPTGEITVTLQPSGKLNVSFELQAVGLPNMGSGGGDAVVKNGATTFTLDGYSSCTMTMKFSGSGQLTVSQSGMPQECGFGDHVTADGFYVRSKPTATLAATKPELSVPGAPSQAECKPSSKRKAQPTNQLEINEQQADLAVAAGCTMRAAYERLDKSVTTKPAVADSLRSTQAAWDTFERAHQVERFPHQGEQGYYGSIVGMCYGSENQASYQTRTLELRGMHPCKASPNTLVKAQADAKVAELAMRDVVAKLRASYRGEPLFIAALGKAQQAFEAWRGAQATYIEAVSGGNVACVTREIARVTRSRTKQLGRWFDPKLQRDACSGSYGPP